jgi:hypothetical protein
LIPRKTMKGMTSISRQGFEYWFRKHSKGIALKFSIGGLEEMLDSKPDTMTINLNQKKGFVKLALKHGYVMERSQGRRLIFVFNLL